MLLAVPSVANATKPRPVLPYAPSGTQKVLRVAYTRVTQPQPYAVFPPMPTNPSSTATIGSRASRSQSTGPSEEKLSACDPRGG